MIILVDMDDTAFEMERRWGEVYRNMYPDLPYIPYEERTTFKMTDQYPEELHEAVRSVMLLPDFYASLEPAPGAVEALNEMNERHSVWLCSRPYKWNVNCVRGKIITVEKYFGKDFLERLILGKDKTLITAADMIIDDIPCIEGKVKPPYEHILFDRPWNRNVNDKRRISSWYEWRSVIEG